MGETQLQQQQHEVPALAGASHGGHSHGGGHGHSHAHFHVDVASLKTRPTLIRLVRRLHGGNRGRAIGYPYCDIGMRYYK